MDEEQQNEYYMIAHHILIENSYSISTPISKTVVEEVGGWSQQLC